MFSYKKMNQKGTVSLLVIPVILLSIATIALSVISVMYYNNYVEQRDNNQPIITKAVEEAEAAQKEKLTKDFTEREKQPLKTYTSPAELGSVLLKFSKTWDSYVDIKDSSSMDFYAHPNFVPANNVNYALRMSVVKADYSKELKKYTALVKKGDLKATSATASGVTGARLDGLLQKDQEGSMVIFPFRDKTLRVWTENPDFRGDFDNIVLKNLTFVP